MRLEPFPLKGSSIAKRGAAADSVRVQLTYLGAEPLLLSLPHAVSTSPSFSIIGVLYLVSFGKAHYGKEEMEFNLVLASGRWSDKEC